MYNNLIQDDIIVLDNEFFKINMMFETVNKIYDIKQRELEYNYIYTESINEEYIDLYTEAEEAKDRKEQGLLGRLFTAILNFIRNIRAKILRFFGNDKKAAELEAKIKGNPKLANQTVEITNTIDAEKAIDEGTSFFGSLIDKIVKGIATEADADAAEEKNKSLLSRIAIFGGGALLAAGGAKVANDKLHITEKLGNLLKREEDTKKKSNEVTQTNEQNVQKGDQALKNNSQSGNEENTKAGRRIMGSFKDFITDVGKFFTGKVSELKSKINGVFSNNNDDSTSNNKKDLTKDEQQTSTSQARPKIVNYPEFSDATDNDKEKLIMDASKAIKTIPQNSERGKREKENLEKIISKGISINSGDYNTLVSVVRNGDISKKYKESNNKKNEQPKNKTDIQMDDEEASIRCKHIIEEIKIYDSTNHVLTKDEIQKINEIDKKVTNKKCNENDLNMVQKINDDMKKRTPDTSRNSNIFNHTNEAETEEPNSYCNRTIKEIETEPGEGAKLTDDEKKQIDEIKDRLKNKKCTRNDAKILDRISDEQDKRRRALLKNDKQNQKNDNKQWNQSIDYRKDFAERLLEHESIDTIPGLKTELERIIKNGKYTDEEYKRMGEIEDRLQFEMILQKVYDDRDKLNSNDQKILDTLIRKTNITANDDKELTILLNKVQYVKYNKKKRNKSNEQQPETQTDKPVTNTNNNNDKIIEPSYGKHKAPLHDMLTKPDQSKYVKPEEKQELEEIEDRIKNKKFTEKDGKYIEKLTMEIIHREEADDESNEKSNETNNNKSDSSEVSLAKEILNILITIRKMVSRTKSGTSELEKGETVSLGGAYAILLKEDDIKTINSIKSTDDDFVDKVKNVTASVLKSLKKDYGVGNIRNEFSSMGITLSIDDAKKKTDEINKARKELEKKYNELENSKTTNESSYDLINNILTVFENSFDNEYKQDTSKKNDLNRSFNDITKKFLIEKDKYEKNIETICDKIENLENKYIKNTSLPKNYKLCYGIYDITHEDYCECISYCGVALYYAKSVINNEIDPSKEKLKEFYDKETKGWALESLFNNNSCFHISIEDLESYNDGYLTFVRDEFLRETKSCADKIQSNFKSLLQTNNHIVIDSYRYCIDVILTYFRMIYNSLQITYNSLSLSNEINTKNLNDKEIVNLIYEKNKNNPLIKDLDKRKIQYTARYKKENNSMFKNIFKKESTDDLIYDIQNILNEF